MTPQEADTLRKDVLKLMVDLDLSSNKTPYLASELSARLGRTIASNNLTMALTGYRKTESYQALLQELKNMLIERSLPPECEHIHKEETEINESLREENYE